MTSSSLDPRIDPHPSHHFFLRFAPAMPLPSAHPASWDVEQLLEQCEIQRTRRSGPGGQHRNKVESAVVITFLPAGIRAEANERRSQADNRRVAIFRLRLRLALECRQAYVSEQAPSLFWHAHQVGQRIRVSSEHEDFPAMLAEALDAVYGRGGEIVTAAQDLRTTASQLCRLIQQHPPAWQQVNQLRLQSGLRRLK